MIRSLLAIALAAGFATAGSAQQCPQPQGWAKPVRHVAARQPRFRFGLKPDQPAQLDLHVQRSVMLATKQGKQGWMNRYAGLAALDVTKPGRLDVLLSSSAYVDLVRDGETLKSSALRRAKCSGIYKIVSFDVKPGRHVLQITDSQARTVRVAAVTP